jgi:undecaprenyl-diphosphatase
MTATAHVLDPRNDTDPETTPPAHRYRSALWIVLIGYVSLTVGLLLIGVVLMHVLDTTVGRWDEHVNEWFANRRTQGWNDTTEVATKLVETLPVILAAAVVTGILAIARRWREAAMFVLALVLEITVFLSVTFVIGRPRPDVPRLNSTPSTSSFPSGHTAAATVFTVGIALIVFSCTRNRVARALTVIVAVIFPILVGFARVYRGMHHPTDVFIGALFGLCCLLVAVLAVRAVPMRGAAHDPDEVDETDPRPAVRRIA